MLEAGWSEDEEIKDETLKETYKELSEKPINCLVDLVTKMLEFQQVSSIKAV